jgi:hypothetical protein
MRFTIKQVRPSGEFWLVRVSARGVWGGEERARTFLNRASAEMCLGKLRPGAYASLQIAHLGDPVSEHSVMPAGVPSEPATAPAVTEPVQHECAMPLLTGSSGGAIDENRDQPTPVAGCLAEIAGPLAVGVT